MFTHRLGLGDRMGGNRLYWKGHPLSGGIVCGVVDQARIPISSDYYYFYGNQKIHVTNGTFPFGGINYYF